MGLLFAEDPHFDETERQTGFYRYRQLLSTRFGRWWKTNLLTLAGLAPLTAGISYAVMSSSVLVLLPCSLLGGMIAGPFLVGMYDTVLRGLRDDPKPWWDCYKQSWKQNWRGSLIPGALLGLFAGVCAFMAMLFWWAERSPSLGTVAIYLFAILVVFDNQYALLAPAGAVPAEDIHPAEELSAVLREIPLAGPGRGISSARVSDNFRSVRPLDTAFASYSWNLVYLVSLTVLDL